MTLEVGAGLLLEFVKDQFRHAKAILAIGTGHSVLDAAGVPLTLPSGEADPGIDRAEGDAIDGALSEFIAAVGRHRHFERQTDPPIV